MNHNSPKKLKPKKFKFRAKPNPEEVKEFRTVDKRSILELCEECLNLPEEKTPTYRKIYMRRYEDLTPEEKSSGWFDHDAYKNKVRGYKGGFFEGFLKAKEIIRKFLLNKQMGYGEAFFFRISDFDELNGTHTNSEDLL